MSSQKTPRIIRMTLSNFLRLFVLVPTVVGLVFYTSPMVSTRALAMNLPYIVGFLGAVVVLSVLYVHALIGTARLMRWVIVSLSWRNALTALLLVAGIFFAAYAITTFITGGWGGVLRDQLSQSFLPEGNLLLKGGLGGAHYLLLLVGLTSVALWNTAQRWPAKFVAFISLAKVREDSSDDAEVSSEREFSPSMDTSNVIDGDEAMAYMSGAFPAASR